MTEFSDQHAALIATVPEPEGFRLRESTVDYELDGVALEGYSAYDAAIDGPRAAVLVVHDWTGLREYPKARTQMLARLGFVGFAVDVYGRGVRPTGDAAGEEARRYYSDPGLLRRRIAAGYDVVAADPLVDPDRIAIVGYCFGGHGALEFARTGAPLRGVVGFHATLEAHTPPEVDGLPPVLIATGGADPVVPDEAVTAFQDELRTRDDLPWQVDVYGGAPHAFTLPEGPYVEWADRRSWRSLVDFLDERLTEVAPATPLTDAPRPGVDRAE